MSTSARPRQDRIGGHHRKVDWQYWPDSTEQHSRAKFEEPASSISLRPDLEDEALISWGLVQSEVAKGPRAKIDILHGQGSSLKWSIDVVDEKTLKDIMQPEKDNTGEHAIRICFINTLECNASWLPGNFSIRPEMLRILRGAGLSGILLSHMFSAEGYWAKMGNQQVTHHNDQGKLTKFELFYQYRCGWDTGVSFINFIRTQRQSTYICINYPSCALDRFKTAVKKSPSIAQRDFLLDSLAADDSLKQWQFEIGHRRRALVNQHERQYRNEDIDFNSSTIQLHKMAHNWLTLDQDISDLQAQLDFLHGACEKYMTTLKDQTEGWPADFNVDMCDSFTVLKSQCDVLKRWTQAYHDRTNIRINLLFHLANQKDSLINFQIQASTAEVAKLTQRDSASMITIAAMTMLFLPGTFISAILSTTYFNYSDDGLHVSKSWWVLVAATIPLTIVVFCVWLGWRYVRLQKQNSLLRN